MFERYNEKARRVVFFARYEASEFGSPEIESEFLLLGLLREDRHGVTRWLGEGDWPKILRKDVKKHVHTGPKTSTSIDLPLSDEAKRVLAYAAEEAVHLKQEHIGTEHLFLGLLREPDSNVAKMLIGHGININTVRETIARESSHGGGASGSEGRTVVSHVTQRHRPEVSIIPEGVGQSLQVDWEKRVPAVGEIISIDQDQGKIVVYQIVRVEWNITDISIWPPHLAKVLIHVKELHSNS